MNSAPLRSCFLSHQAFQQKKNIFAIIQDPLSSDVTQASFIGIKLMVTWLWSYPKSSFQIFKYFWIDAHRNDVFTPENNVAHLVWARTENYSWFFSFIAVNHKQKVILSQWQTQKYYCGWPKFLTFFELKISTSVIQIK